MVVSVFMSPGHFLDSDWYQRCCGLKCFILSPISNCSTLLSNLEDRCEHTNDNNYHRQLHVPYFQIFVQVNNCLDSQLLFIWQSQNPKIHKISFLLIYTQPMLIARIMLSVCISKHQIILYVSFSQTDSGMCLYNLTVRSRFCLLHYFQWISCLTLSYPILYSFGAMILHSLAIQLIFSSFLSHNLHLLFYCLLSISPLKVWSLWLCFLLLWEKKSVSIIRFTFLRHVQIFCRIFLIFRFKLLSICFSSYFYFLVLL